MQPTDPPDPSQVGQTGFTPLGPLPPSAPPPPVAPTVPPPVSTPKSVTRVAVTRRILWVGAAAYPLAMIARVTTTVLVPEKAGAVMRLLRVIGIMTVATLIVSLLASLDNNNRSYGGSSGFAAGPFVVVAVIIVVVYFFTVTLPRLVQPRLYALSVDTAGTPTALLAWESPGPAQQLQATITQAIENPQIEFQQFVHTVNIDRRHYQSGDHVNIYGGHGITGVSK
ncbi:DUF6232 family protein [Kitasatospora sp. NPDC001095]